MEPLNMGKMPRLSQSELNAFKARLKDRTWVIVPNPLPQLNQHMGRLYRTAHVMKVAEYVSPAFMVGEKMWSDGLFFENMDPSMFKKWSITNNARPFICNEGFMEMTGDFDPLDYDHLHVGNFVDSRFDSGYFIIGLDSHIVNMDSAELTEPEKMSDPKGVACSRLVAFGVCTKRMKMTEEECRWCKEEKLL